MCTSGPPAASDAGDYRYTRSRDIHLLSDPSSTYQVLVSITREIWIAPDGSGRIVIENSELMFFGENDKADWETVARGNPEIDQRFEQGALVYSDPQSLPQSIADIRIAILGGGNEKAGPASRQIFLGVRSYLRETVPPAEVAQRLMAVLAQTDGITSEVNVKDSLGRNGTAFAITSEVPRVRERLLLGSETGLLLAEDRTLLDPVRSIDAAPPVLVGRTTYLSWGLTTSAEETPVGR